MTHPTDDELEAMAVRLETRIIQSTMIAEAAAMLRACKGRDKPAYSLADLNALSPEQRRANRDAAFAERGWINPDHFEAGLNTALKVIASIGYGRNQDVDEGHEEAYRAVETYLADWKANKPAALDPEPDNSDWNAAIEAAAKVAEQQKSWDAHPNSISYHMAKDTAAAIRALKRGG